VRAGQHAGRAIQVPETVRFRRQIEKHQSIPMLRLSDYPIILFAISLILLWAAVLVGTRFAKAVELFKDDFKIVQTAILTLLSLLVGFSFSMAVSRYDQRKNYEEEEANAIGTEYVRAEFLPAEESDNIKKLLKEYTGQRIAFYELGNFASREELDKINRTTAGLQNKLWAAARRPSGTPATPATVLVASGMNDVLNSQGYTQAAWLNRIPRDAWTLLLIVAIGANVSLGLSIHNPRSKKLLVILLPIIISISILLISDLDSPRGGLIHVEPVNLISLAQSLG
jgi:hypothetical protein